MRDAYAIYRKHFYIAMRLLVAALALGICIQNTCPCGRAGKSAFLSVHATNESMNKHVPSLPESRDDTRKYLSCVKPLFVFQVSMPVSAAPVLMPCCMRTASHYDPINDVFLEPPFRPPIASLVA